jgi:hypothetical protein
MKKLIAAMLFFIGTAESAVAQKDPLNHEMIFVEGGTFQMGSCSGEHVKRPVHSVTLSSFNIGKYEVTQAQWKAVMGSNPSHFKDCEECPVETVSWNDVQDFIRKLNAQTGKNYRLPTEAEWEFSARGGKSSKGYTYSGSNDLNAVAWNSDNSGGKTHKVGGKHANELGIYDMSGNVVEWCSDWCVVYYGCSLNSSLGVTIGLSPTQRSDSYFTPADDFSLVRRSVSSVERKDWAFGFRLVLPIGNEPMQDCFLQPLENNREGSATLIENSAEYPGGEAAICEFIYDNFVYTRNTFEIGRFDVYVFVKFDIDIDGTVGNITIEGGVPGGHSLEQAAIEVCKKFPKFIPPMRDGKPIKTCFILPINFKL